MNQVGPSFPYRESRALSLETVDLDRPGPGEVLVRIKAAGLCHSDLSVITGDRPRPVPMVLGHEAAGSVEELGDGVTDLAVGDHVVMSYVPSCGHCLPCSQGRPALCEPGAVANTQGSLLSGFRRLHRNGQSLHHHLGVSAFADYAVVSRRSVIPIDKEMPLEEAALVGCAILTGVGAVLNTARVQAGASLAVVGLGGIGLAAVLGARAAGATTIVAIDLSENKLALAKGFGATHTFNAATAVEDIRELTNSGVEFAFETAGSGRAMETAYRITRRGGMTIAVGLPNPAQQLLISQASVVAEERTIKGSYMGSCIPVRDVPSYMKLYRQGLLPVDRLLTDRLTLDDLNEGFDRLHEGKAIRQVVVL